MHPQLKDRYRVHRFAGAESFLLLGLQPGQKVRVVVRLHPGMHLRSLRPGGRCLAGRLRPVMILGTHTPFARPHEIQQFKGFWVIDPSALLGWSSQTLQGPWKGEKSGPAGLRPCLFWPIFLGVHAIHPISDHPGVDSCGWAEVVSRVLMVILTRFGRVAWAVARFHRWITCPDESALGALKKIALFDLPDLVGVGPGPHPHTRLPPTQVPRTLPGRVQPLKGVL